MDRRPVLLRDVAAAAGVSVPTASKVLNGGGRVAPATRDRILAAAEALDFRPDALAQFFATGRSRTIGVLTQNAPATFTLPVLVGAVTTLGARGLASLPVDGLTPANVRALQARRVDGLVVVGDGLGSPVHSVTEHFDVPVVYAFGISDDPRDTSFVPDGVMAGRLGTEHLLAGGRRRLVHVTASGDQAADERLQGVQAVLAEAGLELVAPPARGGWSEQWGVTAARRLLDEGTDVDAVFCGNDQIAAGVLTVLRTAGTRVPEDVAVLGVDNWPGGAAGGGGPLLTTIDPELGALGAAAAEHLLAAPPDHSGGVVRTPCRLVAGASTGAAAL
ncbi:LacI family DNA-binding transcriptional regulator [Auraticoccus monumenti]|uniref:Transcriptional regulator, LacI family n=1 Tax=Auraticoccus monumenti TaxID=675864 RepID=A0A1G6Y7F7_9ACTN|nr:LacI family DNA-binding transcriptional regulator [Auraticoccus monumenti]SDD86222.1 transcriptional regulator, LacI family [Auraticoccus monumenti]